MESVVCPFCLLDLEMDVHLFRQYKFVIDVWSSAGINLAGA